MNTNRVFSLRGRRSYHSAILATVCLNLKCVICLDEVASKSKKMHSVELQDVFVVSEAFLDDCEKLIAQAPLLPLLEKHSLASWGSEVIFLFTFV